MIPEAAASPSTQDELDVEAARGAVRDILGSLRNLEQLLKSVRVGPRALADIIPDVHSSCRPLLRHVRVIATGIKTINPDCNDALTTFVQPRVLEIEACLSKVGRGMLKAGQRLALEKVITRAGGDLHVALGLADLMLDARQRRTVPLDVDELTRQSASFFRGLASGVRVIPAQLRLESPSLSVQVTPRPALGLLAVAVSLAARKGAQVTVETAPGGVAFSIVEAAVGRGQLDFVVPLPIEPTWACAPILAAATLGRFERSDEGARVWLPSPPDGDP